MLQCRQRRSGVPRRTRPGSRVRSASDGQDAVGGGGLIARTLIGDERNARC